MSAASQSVPSGRFLVLPDAPETLTGPVKAWRQAVEILTYEPEAPNVNPMFLERRVYQGSSGRVYPLPFFDRVADEPVMRSWDAIHIENEYVRLMILPEIGGRIHVGYDKVNGYDFFYRQNVIKPALVGLAGPWISGGVEFNWPQHHRPATFMPVETEIEEHADGSVTVWCSDHDPMLRMKGMHGVCLKPGRTIVELKARLYNRTPFTQTFLWWANVATRVHEKYQSFFPTDVRFVADHAKRAITTFPLSDRPYYGVDYANRAAHGVPEHEAPSHFRPDGSYAANDLSWYANIPVPTSYMITGTADDFFGGYDHSAKAGMVHVANHHIAPGKKQWTWGNHEFGYAWDRSLTDFDGPYIELMAGVYTDNQPDFSYLAPWETKTFSQFWYPIRDLGVPQAANTDAALHLDMANGDAHVAIAVTRAFPFAEIEVSSRGGILDQWQQALVPDRTLHRTVPCPSDASLETLRVRVKDRSNTVIEFDAASIVPAEPPVVAREPEPPSRIPTVEELFLTGLHLDQYRHATRSPELYWEEALRRDPSDSRTLNAMGLRSLRKGNLQAAKSFFQRAIDRLTMLNPNPADGEAFYNLGLCLRFLGEDSNAYDAFYKATWNAAWRAAAYFALAELDCRNARWEMAKDHLTRSLKAEADNLAARNLLAYVLRQNGETSAAESLLEETVTLDRLDIGVRWEMGVAPEDGQLKIDLAFDLLRAGRSGEAGKLLQSGNLHAAGGAGPMLALILADQQAEDDAAGEEDTLRQFEQLSLNYCFPHRLEELFVLERTTERHPHLWAAWYLRGLILYDKRRYQEAIACWERAVELQPAFATAWRNLGIAYFNVAKNAEAALDAFEKAFACDPTDGRVLYERDQLWKRIGRSPEERLAQLEAHMDLVEQRDDLSTELATLYNQLGRPAEALKLISSRRFQPWEGGEGLVLAQYVRSHLLLGQSALERGDANEALTQFHGALAVPANLGEAKHLLANQSDVYYWIGMACAQAGQKDRAAEWLERAALHKGDFQQMSVKVVSDMTFWTALALRALGRQQEANDLFTAILDYSHELYSTTPKIDYFATSLPAMLLFEDDLVRRNHIEALFLRGQALLGLGSFDQAQSLFHEVLSLDANHKGAEDLLAHWDRFARKEVCL